MNTVQEPLPSAAFHPPSFPIGNVSEEPRTKEPTNPFTNQPAPPSAQEVLFHRCQFTFSDGRQCTMVRSDIHPSLCPFHSQREDQLFGSPGGKVFGAALDLPELFSASGDLTTATGVNRALALVFRLLVQRRISRQEAATFGHLAQLLLRTISLARAEVRVADSGGVHQTPDTGDVSVPAGRAAADPALHHRALSSTRESCAAPISRPECGAAATAFIMRSPQLDDASSTVMPHESAKLDARPSHEPPSDQRPSDQRPSDKRSLSPGSAPQKNGAAGDKQASSATHPAPASAGRAVNSQPPRNQHLRIAARQCTPNQHLQNLET